MCANFSFFMARCNLTESTWLKFSQTFSFMFFIITFLHLTKMFLKTHVCSDKEIFLSISLLFHF